MLEHLKDYFDQNKVEDLISLIKENFIKGWESQTGEPFAPMENIEWNSLRGRVLAATYGAVCFQRTDLYLRVIRQIGSFTAKNCENADYSDLFFDNKLFEERKFEQCRLYVNIRTR